MYGLVESHTPCPRWMNERGSSDVTYICMVMTDVLRVLTIWGVVEFVVDLYRPHQVRIDIEAQQDIYTPTIAPSPRLVVRAWCERWDGIRRR